MADSMVIWRSPEARHDWNQEPHLTALANQALQLGGQRALSRWQPAPAEVAYVHGERHDLWWEFNLESSFRWQAHVHRIRPEIYQQRLHRLTRALGLEGMLAREVASLTHGTRALADLAVALLPNPALLLWEEPFYLLSQPEAALAVRLVQEQHAAGMALVAISHYPPSLTDLPAHPDAGRGGLLHLA